MERSGYLDLYVTEAQEYMQTLQDGLVTLGQEAGRSALEEAFRAAHTLKGMSALMGYGAVEARAREIEDRLGGVKDGRVDVDDDLIEELLAGATSLGRLITESVEVETSRGEPPPAGARLTVRITLSNDVLMHAATALLIVQRLEAVADVIGSQPDEFGDDFPNTFAVYIRSAEDRGAIEAVLRDRGDVLRIAFEEVSPGPSHTSVPPLESTVPPPEPAPPEPAPPSRSAPPSLDPAAAHTHVERDGGKRVESAQLDALAAGVRELTTLRARLAEFATAEAWEALAEALERVSRLTKDLQASMRSVRLVPIAEVFDAFPGVVQDHARSLGKDVAFRCEGGEIELDRAVLDALAEPLLYLLENGLEHGLESPETRRAAGKPERGALRLRAARGPTTVHIDVEDDGQGVATERVVELAELTGLAVTPGSSGESLTNDELLRLLSRPGFSTVSAVDGHSGYGTGLDRVALRVHRLGGSIGMHTARGVGTRFTIELPLTSPLLRALRLRVGGEEYAIPSTNVAEVLALDEAMVTRVQDEESLRVRDRLVPLLRLARTLGAPEDAGTESTAVLVHVDAQRYALAVHGSGGEEQIAVSGFAPPAGILPIFCGAAALSDGRPVLVLDPTKVL